MYGLFPSLYRYGGGRVNGIEARILWVDIRFSRHLHMSTTRSKEVKQRNWTGLTFADGDSTRAALCSNDGVLNVKRCIWIFQDSQGMLSVRHAIFQYYFVQDALLGDLALCHCKVILGQY